MEYEVNGDEVIFNITTDQPGKWAIIDALKKVTSFWREVYFYAVFKRHPFDTITIKITRDNFWSEVTENNDSLRPTITKEVAE